MQQANIGAKQKAELLATIPSETKLITITVLMR